MSIGSISMNWDGRIYITSLISFRILNISLYLKENQNERLLTSEIQINDVALLLVRVGHMFSGEFMWSSKSASSERLLKYLI